MGRSIAARSTTAAWVDAPTLPPAALESGALRRVSHPPAQPLSDRISETVARIVVGGLFLALVVRMSRNALQTGHVTGLLLLAGESLVVVLTIARRNAITVDRSCRARAFTFFSLMGPPLLRPTVVPGILPDAVTATISAIGLLIVIGGKLSLGRSFGLVPANRGLVSSGLYRFVRHPIYLGYWLTHGAFLASNPTPWNITVLIAGDLALLIRAVYEERTLARDPAYQRYQQQVRWRMVPGLF